MSVMDIRSVTNTMLMSHCVEVVLTTTARMVGFVLLMGEESVQPASKSNAIHHYALMEVEYSIKFYIIKANKRN